MTGEIEGQIAERHLRVCERFTQSVIAADGMWGVRSPCTDWDAEGVVEHVIGFHDVLLLRPMGAKPDRPKDDPMRRWIVTLAALRALFARQGLLGGPVGVPAVGQNPPTRIDAAPLVELLSRDVLVHTWDLARAVGGEGRLDPDLCTLYLNQLPGDSTVQIGAGMFGPPLDTPFDADAQTILLSRLGRDPHWRPPDKSRTWR